jgi:UDP-N-acetylmuramoyl-tripeptide--D-alanyl-D-alanine ligase
MRFDEHFLQGAIPEVTFVSRADIAEPHVSIDTRTLGAGDIFVALKGATTDGHNYVQEAVEKGAAGLIIDQDHKELLHTLDQAKIKKMLVLMVPDTLKALVAMAYAWRTEFKGKVVAITGSVGKSSTKEMVQNILTLHGVSHYCSYGNQNTLVGVAMNMLSVRDEHAVAIFELGIGKRGQMAQLVALARPDIGVITNVGHAHMEGLGSLQDIAIEKRDVFKLFTEKHIGIVNGDQPLLAHVAYMHPVVKFGTKTVNQVQARKIHVSSKNISFILKLYKQKFPISLAQTHEGAIFNSLAAASVAYLLDIPAEVIARGITIPVHIEGRFEPLPLAGARGIVINDCYNANPESMKASLLAFQHFETKDQKIAVLGDMLELGINSPFWHRQLGRFLRKIPSLQHVILVGNMVQWTKQTLPLGLTVEHVPTWQEAHKALAKYLDKESVVFVKGSHGMGLHHLVTTLTQGI